MHSSVWSNRAKPDVSRCAACCTKYHCPLCPDMKPCGPARLQLHLDIHLKNSIPFKDTNICRCSLPCRDKVHFHCPVCNKTIIRKSDMKFHLMSCGVQPAPAAATLLRQAYTAAAPPPPTAATPSPQASTAAAPPPTAATPSPQASATPELTPLASTSPFTTRQKLKVVSCPHCACTIKRNNLPKHILRKHTDVTRDVTSTAHLQSLCIDASNGISAVQKTGRGCIPIHVQKKTWGRTHCVRCELDECHQYHLLAKRSGLPFSQCEHIRSLEYCKQVAVEELLSESVLGEMVDCKVLGEAKKSSLLKRQRAAQKARAPFCVKVAFGKSKQLYLSIHEPTIHHVNHLGRVMVTYKSTCHTWHCPCSKQRRSCPHKYIAKWHLFQSNRELFQTNTSPDDIAVPQPAGGVVYPPTTDLRRVVKYLYTEKRIPADLADSLTIQKSEEDYPTQLLPVETHCTFCPGRLALEKPVLITKKAKIVTLTSVIENVSTYLRRCERCHMTYRYQEWSDGLHNFDDHVIMNLQLCLFLRHSLQNHTSISRAINSLETLNKVPFPARDTLLHAYCHFEALTSHDYKYACVNCGVHPVIVIMDLHKKGVFNMAGGDIMEPSDQFTGEHDIEDFWDSVQLELICRGFVSRRAKNPFAVHPSYEYWAPWIGGHTRSCERVLNTEFAKSSAEAQISGASEDHLVDELMKHRVEFVRKLCKSCNVDSKGSHMDLILRLKEEMKKRQTYDKIFQKIGGASGGWSVVFCPHGVVYSIKGNLRSESPRDFADLLLSWKHFPNVCVYEFARGLATHANLRSPTTTTTTVPFQPHEGRLAESTPQNIQAAQQKVLQVSLPWLAEKKDDPDANGHPATGSSEHYVLYDKLHETNASDPQERLRRVNLVPELQGALNGQVAQQLFASMRKNNYFLNGMAPSMHVFMMRNILHHRNTETNRRILEQKSKRGVTNGHALHLLS